MASIFRRSNGYYYILKTVNNRRVWESTGTRNKTEALKYLIQGQKANNPDANLKFSQFQHQVISYARTNVAPSTVLLYGYAMRDLIRLVGDYPLEEYTPQLVEQFKVERLKKVSPVKVNIDFRTLRAAFSLAVRWGMIPDNPFKKCRQLRIPQQRPLYLSPEEYHKLIAVIDRDWFRDIVRFAVSTMMRLGEIVNLKWASVDFDRKVIFVESSADFRTKTRKSRVLPMDDWVYELLKHKESTSDWVFISPEKRRLRVGYVSSKFKKYVRKAEIGQAIHFHSLGHTGATWLVQSGVPIYTVQHILGHSTIQMTQVYSHLEAENLKQPLSTISHTLDRGKDHEKHKIGFE
ncbi:MAG: tyrosine-type recombinase/integrase [Bacteroidota bacterium]